METRNAELGVTANRADALALKNTELQEKIKTLNPEIESLKTLLVKISSIAQENVRLEAETEAETASPSSKTPAKRRLW